MTFLHFGLLISFLPIISAPIILHLLTLHKLRTIELSTYRFLFDETIRSRRRFQFEDLLLAILRTLFLLLIVMALARPTVDRFGALFGGMISGRDIIVLVDASASMSLTTDGRSALDQAKRVAGSIVENLPNQDRVTVIRVASRPEQVCSRFASNPAAICESIDRLEAGPARANWFAALLHTFQSDRLANPRVYVISDMQGTGWRELKTGETAGLIPDDTELFVINVGSSTPIENHGIIAGAADDQHVLAGLPVTLRPRVVNFSTTESTEVPISVLAGDEEVARKMITVEPGQSAEVELIYTPREAGIQRLCYEIPDDRFAADNVYRFTLSVSSEVNVLLVNGHPSSDPLGDRGLFLRSALTVDQDQIQSLRVREVRQSQLEFDELGDCDVLILADCGQLSATACGHVRKFVVAGGGLLILPGEQVEPRDYNRHLIAAPSSDEGDLLAVRLRAAVGSADQAASFERVGGVDFAHPVFSVFHDPDEHYLVETRAYRRYPLDFTDSEKASWVLARFADGSPMMVARRYGKGRVLLSAIPFDATWSNLPLLPEFVPLVLRMVAHVKRRPEANVAAVIPAEGLAEISVDESWESVTGSVVSESRAATPLEFEHDDGRFVAAFDKTVEAAFYEVSVTDGSTREPKRETLAFAINTAANESHFDAITHQQLSDLLPEVCLTMIDASPEAQQRHGQVGAKRELWRTLIFLALIAIAAELLIATPSGKAMRPATKPRFSSARLVSDIRRTMSGWGRAKRAPRIAPLGARFARPQPHNNHLPYLGHSVGELLMSTNGGSFDHRRTLDFVETPSTDAIERLITRTRRLLRSTWTTTGLAITCGIFVSALLLVTVVDLAMPLSRFLRVVGWLVVFVSGTATLVVGVVMPLLRRLSAVKVAQKIESQLPGIHNRLVSCVELTIESEAATRSPLFHRRLVIEALQRIRGFQPQKVLDTVRLRRAAMFAGGGLTAFVMAALIFGDRMPTAVARIIHPLADIPPNSGVVYEVLIGDRTEPGDCDILRGEDVKFTVVLRGGEVDPPGGVDPLRLELNVTDDEGHRRRVWYDFGQLRDNRVTLTLSEMRQACSYRVHGGGTWSRQHSITLLDRPRITSLQSAVHFPDYMRTKQPQVAADDNIDITGPVDSRVEISVGFEGDVSEGEIELLAPGTGGEFDLVESVAMRPADSDVNWQASFELKQDGFYRIVLRNSLGYANRRMKEGELTAVPDNPPQVMLLRPTEDIVVTSPMEIPVQVAAFDDYGLDDVSLIVEHSYWGETRQGHPFTAATPPRNEDVLFVLDLAQQRLRRDDSIECRVVARDTKGQLAVSQTFSVRVAKEREAADHDLAGLREQLDAVEAMLDRLVREQHRADEIISEIATAESTDAVDGDDSQHQDNPFGEEAQPDVGDEEIWEREAQLAELARLEEQNENLAERLAEALQLAAERAAEAQLLPTEIAEQVEAAEQAIGPLVQQPLEQLRQMAEQMAQAEAHRERAAAAERVSDHLQDNLADLQARLEAIQRAQEDGQHGIEQALANFERELAEQNADAAARELSELSEFVDELREDLQQHQEQQNVLTAQNDPRMSEPAFDALAEQQGAFEQQTQEDLHETSELLNSDPINDLAQENVGGDDRASDNPFEPAEEDSGLDDLWEDAVESEQGHHEEDVLSADEGSDSKSKVLSSKLFKPAIDGSKKAFDEPFGEKNKEPFGREPEMHGREEGPGEQSESWEDAFEPAEGPSESHESESGSPRRSEPGRPEPGSDEPSSHQPSSPQPGPQAPSQNDPRARLAQQQQQHAERLSSAADSLTADQQALSELISALSQATNSNQPGNAQPSNAQPSQQLNELLNSSAMQQALAMTQRMNQMQLPPTIARNAAAQLTQPQGSPEGARTMVGAVEQLLVELGESDPNATSLLMRMQPRQREDLLQGLRQGGPKGYQKLIRDYFIRLSQTKAM